MSANNVIILPLSAVTIGERARKDLGDIAALADSIKELGLLQPIGVDPERRLIFGHRRLEAIRHLGLDSIQARIIEVPSLIQAERAENEIRKDFTHSERVAIGKAIEDELGNRRGQRTDLKAAGQGNLLEPELSQNFDEVAGQRSDDIAAEKAGFGNRQTYRDAKYVVTQAEPELIDAMDGGTIAISTAAILTKADPETQREAAANPKVATMLARNVVINNDSGEVFSNPRQARAARPETPAVEWTQSQLDRRHRVEDGLAVVASLHLGADTALIAWATQADLAVNIDRKGPWGNPFETPADGDRDTVCDNYARLYLPNKPSLLCKISNLKGKVLVCWCHPKRCHGDHLAELANGREVAK